MKKILLSIFVLLWFVNFSNAGSCDIVTNFSWINNPQFNSDYTVVWWVYIDDDVYDICVDYTVTWFDCTNPTSVMFWGIEYYWSNQGWSFCIWSSYVESYEDISFYWSVIWWSCSINWTVIQKIDWDCVIEPVFPENYSQIFVNNIEFPSQPLINVNIPDYITWVYTWSDWIFTLDVGTWYDVDYINSIIDINSYRPDSWDFTNIFVSGLGLIFPYIIFGLFLLFMWKLIKRIFK